MADHLLGNLERHRDLLTSYCGRLLWDPQELPDALQDMMLRAWRARAQFVPGSDFRAWILRIATLTCFEFNRRHAKRPSPLPDTGLMSPDLGEQIEREQVYEELLANPMSILDRCGDELLNACRELTDNERAILLLKAIGGLTCSEVSSVLVIPLGTAQGLLTRARAKLRERLSAYAADLDRPRSRKPE